MVSVYFFKFLRVLPLLALPFLAWLLPTASDEAPEALSPEKVNLALRRTADGLLRQSGDSTSRIPAIEQIEVGVWRVRLEKPFQYDQLPALLQASLAQYNIQQPYEVAVRRCSDATIDLGYHKMDVDSNDNVPCGGRDMPEGCHFIDITFLKTTEQKPFWAGKSWILLLLTGGLAGYGISRRRKAIPVTPVVADGTSWLEFGHSRLDVAGQVLICGGVRQTLTFRETKLLRLFASSPDKLLEREFILQQVWADEGVLVGRSVDVFVSRLRKKLAPDNSVGIVAVHGVGYRLEVSF
jgi:DNA-binding response OmpR family regulator